MKKKTIILLWLVTAYSCSNYSSRLKAVLDYSGTNRAELEKVLDHYSQDPADSLKLKASIFLIVNARQAQAAFFHRYFFARYFEDMRIDICLTETFIFGISSDNTSRFTTTTRIGSPI